MYIALFLNLKNQEYYGDIPEIPNDKLDQVELFKLYPDDYNYFKDDIDSINSFCDTLLDFGDVEFFNANKCIVLYCWIENRLLNSLAPRYNEILTTLKNYCVRASEINTGVVISL